MNPRAAAAARHHSLGPQPGAMGMTNMGSSGMPPTGMQPTGMQPTGMPPTGMSAVGTTSTPNAPAQVITLNASQDNCCAAPYFDAEQEWSMYLEGRMTRKEFVDVLLQLSDVQYLYYPKACGPDIVSVIFPIFGWIALYFIRAKKRNQWRRAVLEVLRNVNDTFYKRGIHWRFSNGKVLVELTPSETRIGTMGVGNARVGSGTSPEHMVYTGPASHSPERSVMAGAMGNPMSGSYSSNQGVYGTSPTHQGEMYDQYGQPTGY